MSAHPAPTAKPPPGAAKHKEQKYTKVPEEWQIELPGKGTERGSMDAYFGGCRSIEKGYARGEVLGHGTYGEVFLATDLATGEQVAAKKIKMDNEKEGFPITAIREIKILSALATAKEDIQGFPLRNNVITLREIVRSDAHSGNDRKGSIYMIFDYMDHDLAGLLERQSLAGNKFGISQTKCFVRQLLFGLALLQHKKVLHRDLKNANLLVNNKGELKIADFGLARYHHRGTNSGDGVTERIKMTNRVITLWYRPPELFLGSEQYGGEIDIWSAGCIMAELLTGKPLFAGRDEPEQAEKIFKIMGAANENTMPGCTQYKDYKLFTMSNYPARCILRNYLTSRGINDPLALDLLEKLLCLDPKRRIDAHTAAMHDWFFAEPKPLQPSEMPKYESSHEMGMKKRRQEVARGGGNHHGQQPLTGPPTQRQRTHGQYTGPQQGSVGVAQQGGPPYGRQPVQPHYPPGAGRGAPAAAVAAVAAAQASAMRGVYQGGPGIVTADQLRMQSQTQQPGMLVQQMAPGQRAAALAQQQMNAYRAGVPGVVPPTYPSGSHPGQPHPPQGYAYGGVAAQQQQQQQGTYGSGRAPVGQQPWQAQRR